MAETWTVRRLLEWTGAFLTRKEVDSPRLSAEMLLAHVLGLPRIKLYTDHDKVLEDAALSTYRELVRRAASHEPIAYLTGKAPFFNLEFEVTPDVLIPRPDTETLVENVLQLARRQPGMESPRVLDLCTGSGCVAIAIARHLKDATVVATDISAAALDVARRNVQRLGVADRVSLEQGDLFDPAPRWADARPFDLIVANPPYIRTAQVASLDASVREFEPHAALDGGLDGLDFHRKILAQAPHHLQPGGRLFLEIAYDQGPLALGLAMPLPAYSDVHLLKDYAGHDRVLTARGAASAAQPPIAVPC